jgi:hypothetical protein
MIRTIPFTEGGRTIWEYLPTRSWFNSLPTFSCHQAIDLVERNPLGQHSGDYFNSPTGCFHYAVWSAEADSNFSGMGLDDYIAGFLYNLVQVNREQVLGLVQGFLTGVHWGGSRGIIVPAPIRDRQREIGCRLIHDVFGNPLHPVIPDSAWVPTHAISLAATIYDLYDFAPLHLLADLLEEAGCPEQSLLDHLRSPGPHVRGCWAVDLVLGKE